MAPGSSSRKNALPRSRLVPTLALTKYTEEDLRTMTSSAWIYSSRLKPVVPNAQATKKALKKLLFLRVKDPLPWVEFKVSLQRVWVTQGLVYIPPGVALDKTPSGRKFTIGRLTSSILNPLSLMLTELQKSPISFDFFEKDVSLWSESREKELDYWDTSVKMQLMLRQRPAFNLSPSSEKWISVTHEVIV